MKPPRLVYDHADESWLVETPWGDERTKDKTIADSLFHVSKQRYAKESESSKSLIEDFDPNGPIPVLDYMFGLNARREFTVSGLDAWEKYHRDDCEACRNHRCTYRVVMFYPYKYGQVGHGVPMN